MAAVMIVADVMAAMMIAAAETQRQLRLLLLLITHVRPSRLVTMTKAMRGRGSDPLPKMARTLFGECPWMTIRSYRNANRNCLYIRFMLTLRELSLAGYKIL